MATKRTKSPINKDGSERKTRSDRLVPTDMQAKTIEILTSVGLGNRAIAAELGVSHDTVNRWRQEFPIVQQAIEIGRAKRQKRAYSCFFNQAFPIDDVGRPTNKGDSSLMIFWMKTQERWKEPTKNIAVKGEGASAPIIEFAVKEIEKDGKAEIRTRKYKKSDKA